MARSPRRELDTTDILLAENVGNVEFTTRPVDFV